jgi:hypothetical protein
MTIREALRKIIKVIQLPHFIDKMSVTERIKFATPTAALDTVATDLCNVVCITYEQITSISLTCTHGSMQLLLRTTYDVAGYL